MKMTAFHCFCSGVNFSIGMMGHPVALLMALVCAAMAALTWPRTKRTQ